MKVTAAVVAALAGTASAKTIKIAAGNGGFNFSPEDVKADVGDMLEFTFYPANHSVAQGSLAAPCQPIAQGGFFSGYHPVTSGTAAQVFRVRVADTKPIYFYCTQPTRTHCQAGMVGVVNAGTNGTVADYKRAAAAASGAPGAPASIFGGELGNANATTTGGSGSATTSGAGSTGGASTATSRASTTGTSAPSGTSAAPAASSSRAAADNVGVAMGGVLGALAVAVVGIF